MRLKLAVGVLAASLFATGLAEATVLRVVVVQVSDAAAYAKAIDQGRALLKAKGSPGTIRVWRARYAGAEAGAVVVSVEYPDMEALAKDEVRMATDPEISAWLASLDKLRKIVSDSLYNELK